MSKFLKCLVISSSVLLTLIGLAVTGSGIYLCVKKISGMEDNEQFNKYYNISSYLVLGAGILLTLCAAFGIAGGVKRNRCCLSVYSVAIVILFLLFAGLAIAFPVYLDPLIKEVNTDVACSSRDSSTLRFINDANQVYINATQSLFCRNYTQGGVPIPNENCTCFIENPNEFNQRFDQSNSTYIALDFLAGYVHTNMSTLGSATRLSQCSNFNKILANQTQFASIYNSVNFFLEFIENTLDCSGICQPTPFYMFSNINRGVPSKNQYTGSDPYQGKGCLLYIADRTQQYRNIVFISVVVTAVVLLLIIIIVIVLCCQKKKQHTHDDRYNMYERFFVEME